MVGPTADSVMATHDMTFDTPAGFELNEFPEPFLRDIETATGDARSALVFSQIDEAREILA